MDGAFQVGEWRVEPQLNTIVGRDRTIHLEPKVMKVLVHLAEHGEEVVAKERLIRAVWPDVAVTDDVLTHAISELRRAFGDDARQPRFILTVPKGGYRLVARMERVSAAEPATARRFRPGVLALVALLVGIAGAVYWLTRPLPAPRVTHSLQLTHSGRIHGVELYKEVFPGLVTDGSRIYFLAEDRRDAVSFVSVAGGEMGAIPVPPEAGPSIDDISPDGSALLIRRVLSTGAEAALWVLPTGGGAARRVADVTAHAATWLRDGQRILYAHGNDVWVARSDGTDRRRLLSLPARAFWLRTSPSGAVFRFTLRHAQTNALSLWEANTDGTNLHELLPGWNNPPSECCGNWTPDGRYFLFQSVRDELASIWALREARLFRRDVTRGPTRMTTGPFDFLMPVASKDGRKVFAVGVQERSEAVRYDLGSRHFVPFLPGVAKGAVRFSRDGQWIVEVNSRGMWRMKGDGTERLQLVARPMLVAPYAYWSPDGTRIVFPGKVPGQPWHVYLISRDGGGPVRVASGDRTETDPDWSPDGSSVIYGRMPDYMGEAFTSKAIHIVDLESGQVSTVPGSEGLFSPHWSPNGRYLVAQPMKQGRLLLFDFVTRSWSELANRFAHNPTWSKDSRYVYAQAAGIIWRVRVSDRKIEDVADTRVVQGTSRVELSGLAPDDSPLAETGYGVADIYAFDWEAP